MWELVFPRSPRGSLRRILLGLYWGNMGIMERKMETTGIIGIMKDQMETTILYEILRPSFGIGFRVGLGFRVLNSTRVFR